MKNGYYGERKNVVQCHGLVEKKRIDLLDRRRKENTQKNFWKKKNKWDEISFKAKNT